MKKELSPELLQTDEAKAALARLRAMRDEEIDFTDMPEATDWSGAVRGKFYRPGEKVYYEPVNEPVVSRPYDTVDHRRGFIPMLIGLAVATATWATGWWKPVKQHHDKDDRP